MDIIKKKYYSRVFYCELHIIYKFVTYGNDNSIKIRKYNDKSKKRVL